MKMFISRLYFKVSGKEKRHIEKSSSMWEMLYNVDKFTPGRGR